MNKPKLNNGQRTFWHDLAEGRKLRDEGVARVTKNDPRWHDLAFVEAEKFTKTVKDFTGEDIRFHCIPKVGYPHCSNNWGSLILALVTKKIIIKTGEYRQMKDKSSHARVEPVYRRTTPLERASL